MPLAVHQKCSEARGGDPHSTGSSSIAPALVHLLVRLVDRDVTEQPERQRCCGVKPPPPDDDSPRRGPRCGEPLCGVNCVPLPGPTCGEVSMMSLRPKPSPMCARCLLPIADGEHVIFDNAEPFHMQCFPPPDRLIDVAAAFLRRRPSTTTCHTCLARALRITVEEARKTTNALRLTGDYDVVFGGRCGICHREAAAIEASGSAARKPPTKVDDVGAA